MAVRLLRSGNGLVRLGESDRVIRVRRLLIASDETGWFVLKQSASDTPDAEISPRFFTTAGTSAVVDVRFDVEFPQTERGDPLYLGSNLLGGDVGVWIEYEVVR